MEKKRSKWWKIVLVIILVEVVVGGILFAYKKLHSTSADSLSLKDKTVKQLYQKIAHEELDTIDILSKEAILYYAYHNIDKKDSINCSVVQVEEVTTDYQCQGIVDFVTFEALAKAAKEVYGANITIELANFFVDDDHWAYVDRMNEGFVIFTKKEASNTAPINLKLTHAEKKEETMILTSEVLDGIKGTTLATYKYIFEQQDNKYILTKKEKVTN